MNIVMVLVLHVRKRWKFLHGSIVRFVLTSVLVAERDNLFQSNSVILIIIIYFFATNDCLMHCTDNNAFETERRAELSAYQSLVQMILNCGFV